MQEPSEPQFGYSMTSGGIDAEFWGRGGGSGGLFHAATAPNHVQVATGNS